MAKMTAETAQLSMDGDTFCGIDPYPELQHRGRQMLLGQCYPMASMLQTRDAGQFHATSGLTHKHCP